jgi:DNA-binding SARP family transcriptional activator
VAGSSAVRVPGPWAEIERVRPSEVRLTAIEERTEIMLMLGRAAATATELTGLVREHPLREALRGQLMLALYRCGRQAARSAGDRAAEATALTNPGIVALVMKVPA